MSFLPHTPEDEKAMLQALGLAATDELFAAIPAELRLARALDLPAPLSELELTRHMRQQAGQNAGAESAVCFLGAGSYDHFISAVVDFVAARSEFYTAYTPYQPEVSQGTLQALFEYQSLVADLFGMEVANASLYDGASAAAEAVLMALDSLSGRNRVLVAASVHPEYRRVLATYLANVDVQMVTVPAPRGAVRPEDLRAALDDRTACVLAQHPNFFGCLEEMDLLAGAAHQAGALLVAVVDPISLGLLRRPGDYGADIAVAEGQALGNPMSFGGPYLGMLACRQQFLRRLPGRLVGQTLDRSGKPCWVLTLQTREQHIRREKATSNICTSQSLLAIRAAVYLGAVGPWGLRHIAHLCLQKAHYAKGRLAQAGFPPAFDLPTFKEFAIRAPGTKALARLLDEARAAGILAGVPLGTWYPELADCLLVAVTEKRTKAEIDQLTECALRCATP